MGLLHSTEVFPDILKVEEPNSICGWSGIRSFGVSAAFTWLLPELFTLNLLIGRGANPLSGLGCWWLHAQLLLLLLFSFFFFFFFFFFFLWWLLELGRHHGIIAAIPIMFQSQVLFPQTALVLPLLKTLKS
jgi:hypothetical protein